MVTNQFKYLIPKRKININITTTLPAQTFLIQLLSEVLKGWKEPSISLLKYLKAVTRLHSMVVCGYEAIFDSFRLCLV